MNSKKKLFNQMKHDFIKVLQIIKSCVSIHQILAANRVKSLYFKKYKNTKIANEAGERYNLLCSYWYEKWDEITQEEKELNERK